MRAAARVYGRGLNDRAAWRDEPVEALAFGELAERAGADDADAREMLTNFVEIERRVERTGALLVELDACFEEVLLLAPDDDARVDELRSLDARYDADHRVVIRARSVHGRPPRRM